MVYPGSVNQLRVLVIRKKKVAPARDPRKNLGREVGKLCCEEDDGQKAGDRNEELGAPRVSLEGAGESDGDELELG